MSIILVPYQEVAAWLDRAQAPFEEHNCGTPMVERDQHITRTRIFSGCNNIMVRAKPAMCLGVAPVQVFAKHWSWCNCAAGSWIT